MAKHRRNESHLAGQVNLLEGSLITMITEVNVIGGFEWWWNTLELRAMSIMTLVSLFKTYSEIKDKRIILRDHHLTKVVGIREM